MPGKATVDRSPACLSSLLSGWRRAAELIIIGHYSLHTWMRALEKQEGAAAAAEGMSLERLQQKKIQYTDRHNGHPVKTSGRIGAVWMST